MSRLESRKQLLLTESELNRALLMQQCQTLSIGYHAMLGQASTYGALASSAGTWIGNRFSSKSGGEQAPVSQSAISVTTHLLKSTQLLLEIWEEIQCLRGK
jgi:hypothetical protein